MDHSLYTSSSYASLASQATLTDEAIANAMESHQAVDMLGTWGTASEKERDNDTVSTTRETTRRSCLGYPAQEQALFIKPRRERLSRESPYYSQTTGGLARDSSIITMMSVQEGRVGKASPSSSSSAPKSKKNGFFFSPHRVSRYTRRPFTRRQSQSTVFTIQSSTATNDSLQTLEVLTLEERKQKVVILLGQCLLQSGCPCHRAQDALEHMAQKLCLDASFSILPDAVLVSFANHSSRMIKSPQSIDMGKIGHVIRVINDYLECDRDPHHIHLDTCLSKLQKIATDPPTWGVIGTCASFLISSFTASIMLFHGSWVDAIASAALGLLVGVMYVLAGRFHIYGPVFEMSACVVVAALARALHTYCCFTSVALSAVLILLPGYSMTVSVMELSARHIINGMIRLLYAVFYAFLLAYGFQMGNQAYTGITTALLTSNDSQVTANGAQDEDALCGRMTVSPWFYIALMPLLSVSISMSYGSSLRQWIPQLGGAVIGFGLAFFLNQVIPDAPVVDSLSAFAVGLYACLVLKLTNEPPLITLSVGVTLLVPGSIGVRGAYALLHQDDLSRSAFPIQMLVIALGLSAGLFAAAMIVYPSGKKRTLFISL